MKNKYLIVVIAILIVAVDSIYSYAAVPYNNYIYDNNTVPQQEPQAYIPYAVYTGPSFGTTSFKNPQDIFVAEDEKIYIADTGNNRILILNKDLSLSSILDSFINEGRLDKFNNPSGVFITKDNRMYIADSLNRRIVILDKNSRLIKIYTKPVTPLLPDSFQYIPQKIAVDTGNRVYVVAQGSTGGIIQIDKDGNFNGFFGAIATPPNFINSLVRRFGTREMKKNAILNIPTVFSNIAIDKGDFIYGTVGSIDSSAASAGIYVHKLNSAGVNILMQKGNVPVMGDPYIFDYEQQKRVSSFLTDVGVNNKGIYSVLDRTTGRIFSYKEDGELLYVFGGLGNRMGQFGTPDAFDFIYEDNYIVVDSKYNQLVLFKPTYYGKVIKKAVEEYNNHNYDGQFTYWQKALKYTSKSELVFKGISKSLFKANNYEESLKYSKLANDRNGYSLALQFFRKQLMANYFGLFMTMCILLIVFLIILKSLRKYSKKGEKILGKIT